MDRVIPGMFSDSKRCLSDSRTIILNCWFQRVLIIAFGVSPEWHWTSVGNWKQNYYFYHYCECYYGPSNKNSLSAFEFPLIFIFLSRKLTKHLNLKKSFLSLRRRFISVANPIWQKFDTTILHSKRLKIVKTIRNQKKRLQLRNLPEAHNDFNEHHRTIILCASFFPFPQLFVTMNKKKKNSVLWYFHLHEQSLAI